MIRVRTALQVFVAVSCLSLLGYIYNMSKVNHIARIFRYKTKSKTSFSRNINVFDKRMNKSVSGEMVPLVTLFTTWPEGGNKTKVWNTTLRNWANFRPLIQPVFFYTNERQVKDIARNGWNVLPVRETAASGLPVLKHMFLDAVKHYDSLFYGYSNGDIIFDNGIIGTLRSVANSHLLTAKKPMLITGVRTNVAGLTEKETRDVQILARVTEKRGTRFMSASEDYFITDASYPWADIPELVIGRIAYDNWLVLNARQKDHTVIDATETLTAVHQTTQSGNFEGWQSADINYNMDLLSRLYGTVSYDAGLTVCAPWMTRGGGKFNITVVQRKKLETKCFPLF